MTPRRRMYGAGPDHRPAPVDEPYVYTGPDYSGDGIDELYGATSPLPDYCCCFRDGEYCPEACDRADHREEAEAL